MSSLITYLTIIFIGLIPFVYGDACKFTDGAKRTIDLSSLSSNDGKANYPDKYPSGARNWKYSFNPCRPFSEGDKCQQVAVCQVSDDGQFQITLAKQDGASWDAGTGATNPILKYFYNDPGSGDKNVEIELICNDDQKGDLVALGEFGTGLYKFQLSSKCSCWDGCKGGSGGGGGDGSGFPFGGIFLIVLVSLLFIYVVGFTAFNCARHQERGLGALPHRTFWISLPIYAKDGVLFLVHKVTRRGGGNYNSV